MISAAALQVVDGLEQRDDVERERRRPRSSPTSFSRIADLEQVAHRRHFEIT